MVHLGAVRPGRRLIPDCAQTRRVPAGAAGTAGDAVHATADAGHMLEAFSECRPPDMVEMGFCKPNQHLPGDPNPEV